MAKIRVEQADGQIVVAHQGDDPVSYAVTDHTVTVAAADVAAFLGAVAGSKTTNKADAP